MPLATSSEAGIASGSAATPVVSAPAEPVSVPTIITPIEKSDKGTPSKNEESFGDFGDFQKVDKPTNS